MNKLHETLAVFRSRLGMNLLGAVFLALAVSAGTSVLLCVFCTRISLENTPVWHYIESTYDDVVDQFQELVTVGDIASTEFSRMQVELSRSTSISLLVTDTYDSTQPYSVQFSDKRVTVLPYLSSTQHDGIILIMCSLIGVLLFVSIVTVYIRNHLLRRISLLSRQMDRLARGELERGVHLPGNDELAFLAGHIESMRQAVLSRIASEKNAVEKNHELITALSHDLRTPLTKQLMTLELARSGKYRTPQELASCFDRLTQSALQIKNRSDQLFEYFLAFTPDAHTHVPEIVDGALLIGQLIDEQASLLRSHGFTVHTSPVTGTFRVRVCPDEIARVFDNLTGNLLKYADPSHSITVIFRHTGSDRIGIVLQNEVRRTGPRPESTGIGVRTCSRLMQDNGGSFRCEVCAGLYRTALELNTVPEGME